jgi:hypothetical protein
MSILFAFCEHEAIDITLNYTYQSLFQDTAMKQLGESDSVFLNIYFIHVTCFRCILYIIIQYFQLNKIKSQNVYVKSPIFYPTNSLYNII